MIDPITLAVIQAGLQQVCDEMDLTFSFPRSSPKQMIGQTASTAPKMAA